ncbi:xylulose-5-phosphate/fructose-6-phosphate phosphoketolase [Rhodococcus sp. LBL1]|nr:xylulose-5-phosphate/fructose-6-phosphate phosphoketolase [Rhodococcus sp. LBL1]MDH6684202.1 xylulose-5-phosphate/fructose-6-phosphate phosphoketolase [Rhodococcus sp. LBL2]
METSPDDDLELLHRYWMAANYLTVAQIYLRDNVLLRRPLVAPDIKPRLLGHWGTSPGLSLVYAHLDRLIRRTDADVLFIAGPGHGGPAVVANTYLEGTYSERFPDVTPDEAGLRRLARQFSTPGGIPSHSGVETPGSINEGGELGYSLAHAAGAAMDNPDLIVACVVGDGEAETGPLSASWKAPFFLDPAHDGAVLPILHLNGYKISGPTVLGRRSDEEVLALLHAFGWDPMLVSGDDPPQVHRDMAETIDRAYTAITRIRRDARESGFTERPRWPAIVLRTPKGWTGPSIVDGLEVEGTFRAHQVPVADVRDDPSHLRILEQWMLSYRPEEQFDAQGRLVPELAALAPDGDRRMGANPHANGGQLLRPLELPAADRYAVEVPSPGAIHHETTRPLGEFLRDVYVANPDNFRLFCPDETNSNRLGAVFEVTDRCFVGTLLPGDDHVGHHGRVMEVLSEHLCQGWLEGYLLTGRHGLFATYEAFAMVSASMTIQHAKWLERSRSIGWRDPVASLNILLTSTCWRNDHNGFSHQGPGLIDTALSLSGGVTRVYLPPDANSLLVVAERVFDSRDCVNLLVVDKQSHPQYLTLEQARTHVAAGASVWDWAGTENGDAGEPDIVLACVGDVPTEETLAAAALLRGHVPELRVRVVNVVDLMSMAPADIHPHGRPHDAFADLFTEDVDVVVAWHGYARAFHQLLHGRANPDRFHVRGYTEQGTTTTPFDMVVLNHMSRYHLAIEALRRSRRVPDGAAELTGYCERMLDRHHAYVREHLEDMPEVRGWAWPEPV